MTGGNDTMPDPGRAPQARPGLPPTRRTLAPRPIAGPPVVAGHIEGVIAPGMLGCGPLDASAGRHRLTVTRARALPFATKVALARRATRIAGPIGSQLHLSASCERPGACDLTVAPDCFRHDIDERLPDGLGGGETTFAVPHAPPDGARHRAPRAVPDGLLPDFGMRLEDRPRGGDLARRPAPAMPALAVPSGAAAPGPGAAPADPGPARWDVCACVQEAAPLVCAFVAHHRHLGAGTIHLFLDGPQPEVSAALADLPFVKITVTDAAFWAALGLPARPVRSGDRQRPALRQVMETAACDWVLHIDADEFLTCDGNPAAILAAQPPETDYVFVPVAERVYLSDPDPADIFAGAFRRPARTPPARAALDAIDGEAAPYLDRGVTGYYSGKSFFRAGGRVPPGIHVPTPHDPARGARPAGLELLHFDGLTARHWTTKKLRSLGNHTGYLTGGDPPRMRQFEAALANRRTPDRLADLYLRLKVLSAERAEGLRRLGLLREERLDPRPALRAVLPGADLDLSVAAFDAFAVYRPRWDDRWRLRPIRRGSVRWWWRAVRTHGTDLPRQVLQALWRRLTRITPGRRATSRRADDSANPDS